MSTQSAEEREAKYGERMIEVKVRFWTDDIAEGKGVVLPKQAWSSGVVRMRRNKTHDITPGRPVLFNSLMELPAAIEKALIAHGITLHASRRTQRYFRPDGG